MNHPHHDRIDTALRASAKRLSLEPSHADDLLQELQLTLLQHPAPPGVDPSRWGAGVLRNKSRQVWRSTQRRLRREARYAEQRGTPSERGPSIKLAESERLRVVRERVRALPERSRAVIELRYFSGLSTAQVAEVLGVGIRTAESRLRRAKDRLRADLMRGRTRSSSMPFLAVATPSAAGAQASALGSSAAGSASVGATKMGMVGGSSTFVVGIAVLAALSGWFAHSLVDALRGPYGEWGDDVQASRSGEAPRSSDEGHSRPRLQGMSPGGGSPSQAELEEEVRSLRVELRRARALIARAPIEPRTRESREDADPTARSPQTPDQILEGVAWERLGETAAALVKITPIAIGQTAPAHVRKEHTRRFRELYAAIEELGERGWPLPGSASSDVLAHPSFLLRLIRATLVAGGSPPDDAQQVRLREVEATALERMALEEAGDDEVSLAIDRLAGRVELLTRFYGDLDAILSPEQHAVLHPEAIRGRIDADYFYPSAVLRFFMRQEVASQEHLVERIAMRLRLSLVGIDAELATSAATDYVAEIEKAMLDATQHATRQERMEILGRLHHNPEIFVAASQRMYRRIVAEASPRVAEAARAARDILMPYVVRFPLGQPADVGDGASR